jgi:hypothetical protein
MFYAWQKIAKQAGFEIDNNSKNHYLLSGI